MPYNYLLNEHIRKKSKIDVSGHIVIFDEAHNIEKIAEESSTFELSLDTFQKSPKFFDDVRKKLLEIEIEKAKKPKPKENPTKDSKKKDPQSQFESLASPEEETDPPEKSEEERCKEALYVEYAVECFLENLDIWKQNLQSRLRAKNRKKRAFGSSYREEKDRIGIFEGREIFNFFRENTQSSSI